MRRLALTTLALAFATGACRPESSANADGGTRGNARTDGVASASPGAASSAPARSTTQALAELTLLRARVPGIAFASMTRDGEHLGAAGLADVARKLDASSDTVFEAASIAKLIVATCVLQLVEDGKLDLDADAGAYVGFTLRHPRWTERITLRMLLTHRASVRDLDVDLAAGAAGNPLGSFLKAYLVREGMPRAEAFWQDRPGTRLSYSNVGAALAALAVERVSGESFASFSTRRVLSPLRMTRTSWAAPSRSALAVATPYAHHDGAFIALPPATHAVYPAVDLYASAGDLSRYARAILRDGELEGTRILSAKSVATMLRADADLPGEALGWQVRTFGRRRVVGHEGEDTGATTGLFLDLATGTGALLLANGDAFGSADKPRAEAIEAMISELLVARR